MLGWSLISNPVESDAPPNCHRNSDRNRQAWNPRIRGRTCTRTCRSTPLKIAAANPYCSIRSWGAVQARDTPGKKVEPDPLGREQCAGEPVLRRWSSPRFIRHSGLADTAHGTDGRVEPLFIECWFNQR